MTAGTSSDVAVEQAQLVDREELWEGPDRELPPSQPAAGLSGTARRWYLLAAEHHGAGRPDRAADLLVSALAREPSQGCLREALARAQYDAKRYLAARTTFAAMTAIDPADHFALFGLGLAETRLLAFEAAARHFQRALRLRPDELRYQLALTHALVAADCLGAEPGPPAAPAAARRSS